MAEGRVITGYSRPWVAIYGNSGTNVTYTNGMPLARGVGVQINPDDTTDNKFYANNVEAEDAGATFGTGTANITVDGLKALARKTIYGLPEADTEGWVKYGKSQSVPYMGFGCVIRYMEDNVTTYEPLILTKIKFRPEGTEANTQEEEIDWQTSELVADIYRDDTEDQAWKAENAAQSTEDAAEDLIKEFLGVETP